MLLNFAQKLVAGSAGAIGIGVALIAVILLIDLVDLGQTKAGSATHHANYAEKVSNYSLVSIDALRLDRTQRPYKLSVARDSRLFTCLGNIRHTDDNVFVDVTALTIAIAAIENYNRNFFRRKAEIYWQDLMWAFGRSGDYTIGLAQIKSSLANQVYRTQIDAKANDATIAGFARTDCGSVTLASILIESHLRQCSAPMVTLDDLIACVVQKYTGLSRNNRLLSIYTESAALSYEELFDKDSELYRWQFEARVGIDTIKAGECVEFNPNRVQLRSEPRDYSTGDASPASKPEKVELLQFGGDRRIAIPPAGDEEKSDTVKIFPAPENQRADLETESQKLRADREGIVHTYACRKFAAKIVDFYPADNFLPTYIKKYCAGDGREFVGENSYIVLSIAGQSTVGGAKARPCPASQPAPRDRRETRPR